MFFLIKFRVETKEVCDVSYSTQWWEVVCAKTNIKKKKVLNQLSSNQLSYR